MRRISWQARKQAERAYSMRLQVLRPGREKKLNPTSLKMVPELQSVWVGVGKIAPVQSSEKVEVAGSVFPYTGLMLHIPVSAPDLWPGDIVEILSDRFGGMAGRKFSVRQAARQKTHVTALRIPVEEVRAAYGGDRY